MDIMRRSSYNISKMDCPSEEQMIRMKLEGVDSIKGLEFDIPNRKLDIIHTGENSSFESFLHDLNLDARFIESFTVEGFQEKPDDVKQRAVLWWVLGINFSFFILEMLYGWISNSLGLIADSLDMLADSVVYGLSLMAIGKAMSRKKNVAKLSGYFQIILALIGLVEVIRRFVSDNEIPVFQNMIVVSILALIANYVSLGLAP